MKPYAEYLRELSRLNPTDYQDPGTQEYLNATAAALEDTRTRAVSTLLTRLVASAPERYLTLLGEERGLRRYPGEYLEAFRYRVLNAWDFWRRAGTVRGMLAALEHMGYGVRLATLDGPVAQGMFAAGTQGGVVVAQAGGDPVEPGTFSLVVDGETFTFDTVSVPANFAYYELPPTRIIEHYHEDRAIWAEFSLFLTPSDPSLNADAWDDGSRWDDGTLWDLTIRDEELQRIRAVVDEIKPAHARLRGIYLVSQWGQDYWDDDTTWDDGTVWDAQRPTTLYLREGA